MKPHWDVAGVLSARHSPRSGLVQLLLERMRRLRACLQSCIIGGAPLSVTFGNALPRVRRIRCTYVKWRVIIVRSLAAFAGAVLVVFGYWSCSKPKPFVDSDLVPERVYPPTGDNAFLSLARATNELYWPEALTKGLDALCEDRSWDDSPASDVLGKNEACLAWFDESFKRQFAFPSDRPGWDEESPYFGALRIIGQLECLRTAQLFHAGKQKEACELALKVAEFGHRLEDSAGAEKHYLVGQAIKSLGLRRLRLMTAQSSLPEEELVRLIQALGKVGANEAGLTNVLKAEYQMQCSLLDDFAAVRLERFGLTNSASERISASNQVKRVFSADRTRMKFAWTTRSLMSSIPAPYCQANWPEYSQAKATGKAWLEWAVLRKHNAYGDSLYYMEMPMLKRLFERKSRENVEVRATQLLLALRIYAMRHHRLPSNLTELIPEFFPRVPLDDFDGKPMRYLPESKLIYSVGPDLRDSRGARTHGGDDLPFEIRF